jgi:hypothetical protein
MADRRRSTDMSRDTDRMPGEPGPVHESGRSGGEMARRVASRDEEKRATERPAGRTRVTKKMEEGALDAHRPGPKTEE